MSKLKIEDIKKDLETKGWKLISTAYKNLDTDLEFECPEGHKVIKSYKSLRRNYECPICKKNPYKNSVDIKIPQKKDSFRILALDQATIISGWAIFDNELLIKYGIFSANEKFDTVTRISNLKNWLINIIDTSKPDLILMEDIQLQDFEKYNPTSRYKYNNVGVTTYKVLAELIGVLSNVCYENQIPFKIIHSATWRSGIGVTGRSRSDKKKSAQRLIKQWYDVQVSEDEADAICLGRYGAKNFKKEIPMIVWE